MEPNLIYSRFQFGISATLRSLKKCILIQFKGRTDYYIVNQNSLPTRLIHSVTVCRLALPASNHWGKR